LSRRREYTYFYEESFLKPANPDWQNFKLKICTQRDPSGQLSKTELASI
jgi:hypothetical protein